jgi:hypothetical protein
MTSGDTLFDVFGGLRPMARELRESPSTVQGWAEKGRVPSIKQPHVLRTARRLRLPVTALLIIFPNGIPADLDDQFDLFRDTVATGSPCHGGVVSDDAPVVACDRGAVLHPEARQ